MVSTISHKCAVGPVAILVLFCVSAVSVWAVDTDQTGTETSESAVTPTGLSGAYARDGRIHVGEFGAPDGEPITTGPGDMKPSWSKTNGKLVFFRLIERAPRIPDWKTAICVVNTDGTGFRKLTDGTHTDFNPTWTRDGTELVVLNRRRAGTESYTVYTTTADASPGEEVAVSDESLSTFAFTCLKDGRMFVWSGDHLPGPGYFLMTPSSEGKPTYERVKFTFPLDGFIDRVSLSPSETRLCCEYQKGSGPYRYPGRTLYIGDFDVASRTVSNPVAIANAESNRDTLYLYPRWTKDESAVVYHGNQSGKNQLYMYRLRDKSTVRVSTNANANYMFPCGETSPK